jgi:hypothetical protein
MCIKIEVKSPAIIERSGVSAKTGKPYSIREQEAYAHTFDKDGHLMPYPVRIRLSLGPQQPPYAPGNYQLDPSCIYVDQFGGLTLSRPRLLPIAQAVKQAA